jgi:hypothetical protein
VPYSRKLFIKNKKSGEYFKIRILKAPPRHLYPQSTGTKKSPPLWGVSVTTAHHIKDINPVNIFDGGGTFEQLIYLFDIMTSTLKSAIIAVYAILTKKRLNNCNIICVGLYYMAICCQVLLTSSHSDRKLIFDSNALGEKLNGYLAVKIHCYNTKEVFDAN